MGEGVDGGRARVRESEYAVCEREGERESRERESESMRHRRC